jgi:16S rRNA (guanine966-N2)-methyltransferase
VRPTTDRVKEAMFSMIADRVPGAVCLDLFAGSGALGIEALSRGAAKVYFCDTSARWVRANAGAIVQGPQRGQGGGQVIVIQADWRRAIARVAQNCNEKVNIVFIDAPYKLCEHYPYMLEALLKEGVLADGACVVIERDAKQEGYLQALPPTLWLAKTRRYGNTAVDVLA